MTTCATAKLDTGAGLALTSVAESTRVFGFLWANVGWSVGNYQQLLCVFVFSGQVDGFDPSAAS